MNMYKAYGKAYIKYDTLVQYMRSLYDDERISHYEYRTMVNYIFKNSMKSNPKTIRMNSIVSMYRNAENILSGFHKERLLREINDYDIPDRENYELSRMALRKYIKD